MSCSRTQSDDTSRGSTQDVWILSLVPYHWAPLNKSLEAYLKYYAIIFQLAFYDQIKYLVMKTGYAKDNLPTHFTCSFMAVSVPF